MKEILCIIPARSGSKEIKDKILNYLMVNHLFHIQLNKNCNVHIK